MVGLVVAAVILLTPQCAVEHQALLFDLEAYNQAPDPDLCSLLVERISAYNNQCEGDMELLSCG